MSCARHFTTCSAKTPWSRTCTTLSPRWPACYSESGRWGRGFLHGQAESPETMPPMRMSHQPQTPLKTPPANFSHQLQGTPKPKQVETPTLGKHHRRARSGAKGAAVKGGALPPSLCLMTKPKTTCPCPPTPWSAPAPCSVRTWLTTQCWWVGRLAAPWPPPTVGVQLTQTGASHSSRSWPPS